MLARLPASLFGWGCLWQKLWLSEQKASLWWVLSIREWGLFVCGQAQLLASSTYSPEHT